MNQLRWKERIREEYEMPARQVICLFAKDRYSKWFTAKVLNISVNTLKAYCARNGIQFPDRINLREDCKPKPWGKVNNPLGRRAWR